MVRSSKSQAPNPEEMDVASWHDPLGAGFVSLLLPFAHFVLVDAAQREQLFFVVNQLLAAGAFEPADNGRQVKPFPKVQFRAINDHAAARWRGLPDARSIERRYSRAGQPLSNPSALKSSSTSGQCTP